MSKYSMVPNTDGSLSFISDAGNVVGLKLLADGTLVKLQSRVPFTLSGGVATVDVPSWATKITVAFHSAVHNAAGQSLLQGFNSGVVVTSGYNSSLVALVNGASSISVGTANDRIPITLTGVDSTFLIQSVITLLKRGSVWQVTVSGNVSSGGSVIYTGGGVFTAANLTKLQISNSGGTITSGNFDAIFE